MHTTNHNFIDWKVSISFISHVHVKLSSQLSRSDLEIIIPTSYLLVFLDTNMNLKLVL